jgi:hypothetical protein
MSYPPPLYRGTTGEITVSYRPAGQPPDIVSTRTGNQVHYLATGESTGGKFGLYRWGIDTQPGDWVHVPEGGIHGFKNRSGSPAAMLLHFAPGAPREEYFERLPHLRGQAAGERRAFFDRHDTYWV